MCINSRVIINSSHYSINALYHWLIITVTAYNLMHYETQNPNNCKNLTFLTKHILKAENVKIKTLNYFF